MDKKTAIEVVKFAEERYGNKKDWYRKMLYFSPEGIARLYLKEYVNYEEQKMGGENK